MQQGLLSGFNPSDALMPPAQQGYRGLLSRLEQRDKVGAGINPYQATAFGSAFLPSAGISDVLGFAPDPNVVGGTLPSFSENMDQGNYIDAGLQTLGASGDVMLASAPFAPFLLAPAVGAKLISQVGKGFRGASKVAPETGLLGKTNEIIPDNGLLGKVDNVQAKTGIAEIVPPTDKSDGIFAFHGSADDFDEFKLSKIGTGEGAQAFGNGLYFTDSKDIAKFYRDSVRGFKDLGGQTDWKYKDKSFDIHPDDAQNLGEKGVALLVQEMRLTSRYPDKAKETLIKKHEKEIKRLKQITKGMRERGYYPNMPDDILGLGADIELEELIVGSLQREIDAIKKVNLSDIKQSKGKTYEVNIKTVTDDLLDYDKPLSEQSETVKKVIESLRMNISPKTKGSQIYEQIGSVLSEPPFNNTISNTTNPVTSKKVSEKLNSLGVKGIKYNAGKLSGKESDATNYVIFDDKIIDIMAKYGIVGAIGVSAMQGRGNQSPEADLSST